MTTSKKSSTAAIVGTRLRRYLGALLALGFGAAWWSFVPPSTAAASVPEVASAPRVVAVPAVPSFVPAHPTIRLVHVVPRKRPRRVAHLKPPVIDDVTFPPITTRSS